MKLPQHMVQAWARIIGPQEGVPHSILAAQAWHESHGDTAAVGKVGEIGLMQIRPSTALSEFGVGRAALFDPRTNLTLGARYLRKQFDRYQDWRLALSAYNAGRPIAGNVSTYVDPIMRRAGGYATAAGGAAVVALLAGVLVLLGKGRRR